MLRVCSPSAAASDDEFDVETPQLEAGFSNVIFVHNLPVVPPEKFEKLVSVVRKIYSQIGVIPDGAPRSQPPPFWANACAVPCAGNPSARTRMRTRHRWRLRARARRLSR